MLCDHEQVTREMPGGGGVGWAGAPVPTSGDPAEPAPGVQPGPTGRAAPVA